MASVQRGSAWPLVLALSLAGWLLHGSPAGAQTKLLKLGWAAPDISTQPQTILAREFKARVESRLGDQVKIKLYPNRLLGDEAELLDALQDGTADAGIVANPVLAHIEKTLQVNDLPFIYRDGDQARRVLGGELGQLLVANVRIRGLVDLCICDGGFRHMVNNVRPIRRPSDMQKVRYRVRPDSRTQAMVEALGGTAVPLPWADIWPALKVGSIDGFEAPPRVVAQTGLFEHARYVSLTYHTYTALHLLMSNRAFGGLTGEQRTAIQQAAVAACAEQYRQNSVNTAASLSALREKGLHINDVEDLSTFRQKLQAIYDEQRAVIGDKLLARFLATR